MAIKILFFASLADKIGKRETSIASEGINTARDVWNKCTNDIKIPGNALVAINQKYADFDATVSEGDEVAFFPPVTGG